MATPPSILPLRYPLPDHILCQIAELTDLDTIWSLRRVCHATREAADRVLRPYLIEQRVVASPALILDGDYSRLAFISLSTKDYSLRGQQLRLISQRFQRHLDTYTPSCTLVRKLTIEVRDDDLDTGWPQMARLASQLETLEIHIFDRFWHSVAWSDENEVYNEKIGANCVIERSWARLFNFNKPLATSSFLINLTSLTIQATARTFYHFRQIAPHVPGLRELTLGLHWLETDKDLLPYEFEYAPKFTLLNLHRITLIGLDKWMTSMLSMILLPSSPNLRLLDIRRLRNIVTPDTHHLLRLVQSIAQSPHLQGLVVYGIDSKDFLSKIIDVQRAYSRVLAFRNITTITIELTDSDGLGSDPLLQGPMAPRLELPALQRVSWIDRRSRFTAHFPPAVLPVPYTPSLNDTQTLKSIFTAYSTLRELRCLTEFPEDPFAAFPCTIEPQPGMIACVYRSEKA